MVLNSWPLTLRVPIMIGQQLALQRLQQAFICHGVTKARESTTALAAPDCHANCSILATVKQCILEKQMRVGNGDTSPFTAYGREWRVKLLHSFIMEDGLDKACACEGALSLVSHDQACTGLQPLRAVHEAEPDQGNAAR